MPLRESTKLPVRVVLLKLYKLIISSPPSCPTPLWRTQNASTLRRSHRKDRPLEMSEEVFGELKVTATFELNLAIRLSLGMRGW